MSAVDKQSGDERTAMIVFILAFKSHKFLRTSMEVDIKKLLSDFICLVPIRYIDFYI